MRAVLVLALMGAGWLAVTGEEVSAQEVRSAEEVLRAQLRAFNDGNVEAMVANIGEDFAWFAVESNVTTIELQGREAFRRSMESYFAAIPSARAEIEEILAVGSFVAVRERTYWDDRAGRQTARVLGVYEIRDGLIRRVWYYPADP